MEIIQNIVSMIVLSGTALWVVIYVSIKVGFINPDSK